MGKLLRWLKKMEYIKMEWRPPCRFREVVATFRTSTGWKIEENVVQKAIQGILVSAEGLKNDLDELD